MTSRGYGARDQLTPRMREVLRGAAAGETARETGLCLHISTSTVKTIRAAACDRLEARNVTAAVAIAYRRGEL